jgi:hypothetical protein
MLEVGDIVQLNSGSLSMTVIKVLNSDYVSVAWFYEGGFKADDLPIKSLKVIK